MPYRLTGRDRITGKRIPAYVSSAASESAARAEASARGIEAESVEALPEPPAPPAAEVAPTDASPPATATRRVAGGYEFNRRQNEVIDKVARYMNIAGWAALVLGSLQVLIAFLASRNQGLVNFIQGLTLIIVGLLTRRVAGRFREITRSSGRDMVHLMHALTGLRTLYTFQVWVLAAVIGMIVLIILWALLSR